jgi:hypothetical protein
MKYLECKMGNVNLEIFNRLGREAVKAVEEDDFLPECTCGAFSEKVTKCPICGHWKCEKCDTGYHKAQVCFPPGRISTSRIPGTNIYRQFDTWTGEGSTAYG